MIIYVCFLVLQENVDNLENHSNVGFWDIFEKKYYRPIGVSKF